MNKDAQDGKPDELVDRSLGIHPRIESRLGYVLDELCSAELIMLRVRIHRRFAIVCHFVVAAGDYSGPQLQDLPRSTLRFLRFCDFA
jgi:hypothetical protein